MNCPPGHCPFRGTTTLGWIFRFSLTMWVKCRVFTKTIIPGHVTMGLLHSWENGKSLEFVHGVDSPWIYVWTGKLPYDLVNNIKLSFCYLALQTMLNMSEDTALMFITSANFFQASLVFVVYVNADHVEHVCRNCINAYKEVQIFFFRHL